MAYAEYRRINGKDETMPAAQERSQSLYREWRTMMFGASLVMGALAFAWKFGVFNYDKRISLLEEQDRITVSVLTDMKNSMASMNRKLDDGFSHMGDRFERIDERMLNLVASGTLQKAELSPLPESDTVELPPVKPSPPAKRKPKAKKNPPSLWHTITGQ